MTKMQFESPNTENYFLSARRWSGTGATRTVKCELFTAMSVWGSGRDKPFVLLRENDLTN